MSGKTKKGLLDEVATLLKINRALKKEQSLLVRKYEKYRGLTSRGSATQDAEIKALRDENRRTTDKSIAEIKKLKGVIDGLTMSLQENQMTILGQSIAIARYSLPNVKKIIGSSE